MNLAVSRVDMSAYSDSKPYCRITYCQLLNRDLLAILTASHLIDQEREAGGPRVQHVVVVIQAVLQREVITALLRLHRQVGAFGKNQHLRHNSGSR